MRVLSNGDHGRLEIAIKKYRDIQCCRLRGWPHNKLPNTEFCDCCGCCAGAVGTCTSRGTELARACGHRGGGGCPGEGDDDAEMLLGVGFGGGEGGRGLGLGCGRSSGIGILLRCTVMLDGGVYAFAGGSSSLMRCSPTEGLLSYITYCCKSSDSSPELTSGQGMNQIRDVMRSGGSMSTHHVCVSSASRAQLLAGPLVRRRVRQSER